MPTTRPSNPFANEATPADGTRGSDMFDPGDFFGVAGARSGGIGTGVGSGFGETPPKRAGQETDPFGFGSASSDPFDFGSSDPFGFGAPGPSVAGSERFRAHVPIVDAPPLGTDSPVEKAFELAALNPLVGVASPLLWLAARLNESMPVDDVQLFRSRVMEEIGRFETNAMARGVSSRIARVARYVLCATIDDIVLNTDWGSQSDWPAKGLVSTFYQETWGGERFFDLLNQLYAQPEENLDGLELMALCLSIGFVGKYRVGEGGGAYLNRLRTELYRTIRRIRGPHERTLSADFQALDAPYRPPVRMTGFWILSAGVLLALLILYLVLGVLLSWRVDAASERLNALAPAIPILVASPSIPDVPDPLAAEAPTQLQRIETVLAPEIAGGQVEVAAENGDVVVRLIQASFPSGGTVLADSASPLIRRIAAALDPEPGPITVIGHTDNVPIANPTPTRNNDTLSSDRAASAAAMLQRFLDDPARVSFLGQGDSAPIASNATPQGRARNRRVEFRIPSEDGA